MSVNQSARDPRDPVFATVSGRLVSLLNPAIGDIDPGDIAFHLSRLNRYGGAVDYNVADHSVRVCDLIAARGFGPSAQLAGLLHDGHEYAFQDWIGPAKRALVLALHRALNDSRAEAALFAPMVWMDCVIFSRFGLPASLPDAVRAIVDEADRALYRTEKRDLNRGRWRKQDWGQGPDDASAALPEKIVPRTPETSRRLFLKRLRALQPLALAETTAVARYNAGVALLGGVGSGAEDLVRVWADGADL